MSKRKIALYSIAAALILVSAGLAIFFFSPDQRQQTAKEFLSAYYTVGSAQDNLYTKIIDSASTDKIESILKNEYGDILTQDALDDTAASRIIIQTDEFAYTYGDTLYCQSIAVEKNTATSLEKNDYHYTAVVEIIASDGTTNTVTLEGTLTVIKENGDWMIDSFQTKADIQNAIDS